MAPLSPAESLFLLKPNRTPARETVKVTLLSLLAQGAVRMEERETRRFFRKKKTVYMWPRNIAGSIPSHAAALLDLVRSTQDDTGSMADLAKRAQKAFGTNLVLLGLPGIAKRYRVVHFFREIPGLAVVIKEREAAAQEKARAVGKTAIEAPDEPAACVETILAVVEIRVPLVRRVANQHVHTRSVDRPQQLAFRREPRANGRRYGLAPRFEGEAEKGEEQMVVLGLKEHVVNFALAPQIALGDAVLAKFLARKTSRALSEKSHAAAITNPWSPAAWSVPMPSR